MSIIKANKIQTIDGTTYNVPIQVVYNKTSGDASWSANFTGAPQNTPTSTGFSVSITPKFATSKLLVMYDTVWNIGNNDGGSAIARGMTAWIYRDGVNQHSGGSVSGAFFNYNSPTTDWYCTSSGKIFVNSNSTATTTFTLYAAAYNAGRIRLTGHDGQASLTVMEIAQ